MAVQFASAQARKTKEAKGPRALGLVELSADGKARLVPISIVVDGKFYDAGAYKASPVPLALWNETVYEAEKSGVSQGLFTVAGAIRGQGNNWFGEGKWRPAGSEPKARPKATTKPKLDDDEGPPTLRRQDPAKPQTGPGTPASSPAPSGDKTSSPAPSATPAPTATTPPAKAPTAETPASEKPPDGATASDTNDDDPNRPVLKRGKTETQNAAHPEVGASTGVARRPSGPAAKADIKKSAAQSMPAISDAAGPEPRPYLYDIKPDEEQKYRKGMLALAADAVMARVKEGAPAAPAKPASRTAARAAKATQPTFDDIQFRAFDLWNTNEPVFVLSATAHASKPVSSDPTDNPVYYVTMVAKKNIYDELRKLYTGVTDPRRLDQTPRMELIDAVDADGDGRGELLFRRVSDTGSAWGVYRAGADQLVPLFEGTPAGQ
jgi:hypothetical protein